MTYGEFCELCYQKIREDNPRALEGLVPHSDAWYKGIVESFSSIMEAKLLLMDEIGQIYALLLYELGMPETNINQLSKDFLPAEFVLPVETTKRAERLRTLSFVEPAVKQ